MVIFVGVFVGDGAGREVEFADVGAGDGGVLFDEFGKGLFEELMLILMLGD